MSEAYPPVIHLCDQGYYEAPQLTAKELRQSIETAILHCIQYKARAIEAAEKIVRKTSYEQSINRT